MGVIMVEYPNEFLEKEISRNPNALALLTHLKARANNGIVETKHSVLSQVCGMSIQNVRTALKRLKKENIIIIKRSSHCITITLK